MDISGETNNQRIIIENKIFSGLNGLEDDGRTQLDAYYRWGKEYKMEPLCFITVPDTRLLIVKNELKTRGTDMEEFYKFVTYGEIVSFLEKNNGAFKDWYYKDHELLSQAISAFRKHSYSELQHYAMLFNEQIDKEKQNQKV